MTRRAVITSRRADEDITAAIDHYLAEDRPNAAASFVDELEAVFDLLSEHPSIGSARFAVEAGIAELRSVALRRFPYIAFYIEGSDGVRVVRVLHSHRDLPPELQPEKGARSLKER